MNFEAIKLISTTEKGNKERFEGKIFLVDENIKYYIVKKRSVLIYWKKSYKFREKYIESVKYVYD